MDKMKKMEDSKFACDLKPFNADSISQHRQTFLPPQLLFPLFFLLTLS